MKKLLFLCLFAAAACAPGAAGPAKRPANGPAPARVAPDSFLVTFTTSKGQFIAKAHRNWSPAAVDRFYELTKGNVWKDARFFRVVPQFVVQWGVTGDSARDHEWLSRPVPDEPVRAQNTRGKMSFARGGPRTRTLQVFINLSNNSASLDDAVIAGVRGYPPFAEVIEGMNVVDKFEARYGDRPTQLQDQMSTKGWAWLDAQFPGLDRIISTQVTKEWRR